MSMRIPRKKRQDVLDDDDIQSVQSTPTTSQYEQILGSTSSKSTKKKTTSTPSSILKSKRKSTTRHKYGLDNSAYKAYSPSSSFPTNNNTRKKSLRSASKKDRKVYDENEVIMLSSDSESDDLDDSGVDGENSDGENDDGNDDHVKIKKGQNSTNGADTNVGIGMKDKNDTLISDSKNNNKCYNDIFDTDDEENETRNVDETRNKQNNQHEKKQKYGSRRNLNVKRIAIGSKVFTKSCNLSYQIGTDRQFVALEFMKDDGTHQKNTFAVNDESIEFMKFYLYSMNDNGHRSKTTNMKNGDGCGVDCHDQNERQTRTQNNDNGGSNDEIDEMKDILGENVCEMKESIEDEHHADKSSSSLPPPPPPSSTTTTTACLPNKSYLILRVSPNQDNGLAMFSNCYLSDDTSKTDISKDKKKRQKRFIVIECEKCDELCGALNHMRQQNSILNKLLDEAKSMISHEEIEDYISSLIEHDLKGNSSRRTLRSTTTKQSSYLRPVVSDEVILVYPFDASHAEIDSAAGGLLEANGLLSVNNDVEKQVDSDENISTIQKQNSSSDVGSDDDHKINYVGKTHFLTVGGEDYQRLRPGEYLNDTLIDLWIKWILRREKTSSSDIHFFSTQFFQKLQDEGAQAVESWTKRKKIDIFEKKFIFIPINDVLHWSLCVVVNPGKIYNVWGSGDQIDEEKDAPFLLLLDSLKAHKSSKVKKHVYEWLNAEAKRLDKFQRSDGGNPFNYFSMPIFSPKIPYQNNGWDCGVFVCRYAFAILQLREKRFCFKGAFRAASKKEIPKMLADNITCSDEFKFSMDDISRMRREFAILIDNLSDLYKKKLKAKKAAKQVKLGVKTRGGIDV